MNEHFTVLVTTAPELHSATRELATRLASRSNAVLLFLHVAPLRRADGEAMLSSAMTLASGEHEAWLRAQLPTEAGVRFRHRFEVGEPEEIVARFVAEHDVDLVVAEEPPRSWLSQALWRGLAERLIQKVECPVVIGGPGFLRAVKPKAPPIRSPLSTATIAELLNAMVDARADALRCWMDQAADAVQRVAQSESIRFAVASASRREGRIDAQTEQRMRVELDEHQRALRAAGWQLTSGERVLEMGLVSTAGGPALSEFLERVDHYGHSTSLPIAMDDDSGRLIILAGASLEGGAGMLLFSFDAETEFLRILGQPGPLPSFETYAFDEQGLMLSNSRFPEHLFEAGLLPAEDTQTPLRLRVAEPADGPTEAWPLTHMVQQATRHRDGFNTAGYLDYRGLPVVGAWRWIPEYGFGVAAEVDRDAAFSDRS